MADQGWITVDSQAISIMTVLLFGAGTDYCLFLISHYRTELRKHENKRQALIAAFKDSSGAIAMSGLTIVISLLVLLVATYGSYQRFAVPFSLSILVMMLAALTLVPALASRIRSRFLLSNSSSNSSDGRRACQEKRKACQTT